MQGVNINRRGPTGETPLHIAVRLGRTAATKFLLSKNSNVHARDGAVTLGHKYSKLAKTDETFYAQIFLCVSLVYLLW